MDNIVGLENKGVSEIKRLCGKYAISYLELSMQLHLVPVRIYEIVKGKRGISIGTDLRLCRFFGLRPGHFFALQTEYDFAIESEKLDGKLAEIVPVVEGARRKGK